MYPLHPSIINTQRVRLEVASHQGPIHLPLTFFFPICSQIPFWCWLPHISSVLYLSSVRWAVCSPSFSNFSNGRIDNCCFAAFLRCENTNGALDKSVCAPEKRAHAQMHAQAYTPNTHTLFHFNQPLLFPCLPLLQPSPHERYVTSLFVLAVSASVSHQRLSSPLHHYTLLRPSPLFSLFLPLRTTLTSFFAY